MEPEEDNVELISVRLEPVADGEPERLHVRGNVVLDATANQGRYALDVLLHAIEGDDQTETVFTGNSPAELVVATFVEKVADVPLPVRHRGIRIANDVARWLLENIDYAPSSDELSDYAKMLGGPVAGGTLHIIADRFEFVLDGSENVETIEGHLRETYFGHVELSFVDVLDDDESDN